MLEIITSAMATGYRSYFTYQEYNLNNEMDNEKNWVFIHSS